MSDTKILHNWNITKIYALYGSKCISIEFWTLEKNQRSQTSVRGLRKEVHHCESFEMTAILDAILDFEKCSRVSSIHRADFVHVMSEAADSSEEKTISGCLTILTNIVNNRHPVSFALFCICFFCSGAIVMSQRSWHISSQNFKMNGLSKYKYCTNLLGLAWWYIPDIWYISHTFMRNRFFKGI